MPCFQNEGHYRSENSTRDKFLGVFSHGSNKDFAGLANFDFSILRRNMKTSIARKNFFSELQRDSNPWPLRVRCSTLPAEL